MGVATTYRDPGVAGIGAQQRFNMRRYPAVASAPVQVRPLLFCCAAVAIAAVAGCAVKPPPAPAHAARAGRLEASGQYGAAADAWLAAAASAAPAVQAQYRLNAAEDYDRAGNLAAAWQAAAPVAIAALAPAERFAGARTKARLALATHRPSVALAALAAAPPAPTPAARAGFLELEGRALFAAGEPGAGVTALVTRGKLLTGTGEILANDELLWGMLVDAPSLPSVQGLSQTAQGWVALAQIWRSSWEVPGEFSQRLADWRAAYPDHPAEQGLIAEIQAEERARLRYPAQIALLLPLSGPYAAQAGALESGILAAYYQDRGSSPVVTVYDTDGTGSGARAALNRAVDAGATFVLGPVTSAGVGGAASANPQIPVLALNYLGSGSQAPPRFFQFGLSPREEAALSAQRAVSQGLARAVVLVPDNAWGSGIAAAFTRSLTQLGGRVLASATFQPDAEDFGAPLSAVFGLDASQAREERLAAVLGQPLGFQPRRRRDVQFVFFAAPFDTARLLVPQIDYYQGIGLPVFSISNVYKPGATHPDLDGVRFPVMPWFVAENGPIAAVREEITGLYPQVWSEFAPLYALGYDAWRLVPLLANAQHPLRRPVRGVTGRLSLGAGNVIQRDADWGRYVNGRLVPVTAPAPTTPPAAGTAAPP